jgi:hypothetical protein
VVRDVLRPKVFSVGLLMGGRGQGQPLLRGEEELCVSWMGRDAEEGEVLVSRSVVGLLVPEDQSAACDLAELGAVHLDLAVSARRPAQTITWSARAAAGTHAVGGGEAAAAAAAEASARSGPWAACDQQARQEATQAGA